jgi:hypothetical protein
MSNIFEKLAQEANNNSNNVDNNVVVNNENAAAFNPFEIVQMYQDSEYTILGESDLKSLPQYSSISSITVVEDDMRDNGLQAKVQMPGRHCFFFLGWELGKIVKVGDKLNKEFLKVQMKQKGDNKPIFVLIGK